MENHIEVEETSSKRDKGFTLVELLIVIVILGILATITVFAVRGITDKGQKSACAADKNTLQVAVESYFAQQGGVTIPGAGPDYQAALVGAGLMRTTSTLYAVDTNGGVNVTAAGTAKGCS